MTPYLLLVASHVIADFSILIQKARPKGYEPRSIIPYALRHAVVTIAIMHVFGLSSALWMAVTSAALHVIINRCLHGIAKWKSSQDADMLVVLEQVLHLYSLTWIAATWAIKPDASALAFWQTLAPPLSPIFVNKARATFAIDKVLACLITYIYVAFGGSLLVRSVLNATGFNKEEDSEHPKAGQYVGMIERVIVLTFVLCNSLSAVAFVLTAKSIVRYPKLREDKYDQAFAEYFLVGTLLSVLVALAGGLLLQKVLVWLS